jgi:hypothetical protein
MLQSENDRLAEIERRVIILETRRHEQLIFIGIVILIFLVIVLK